MGFPVPASKTGGQCAASAAAKASPGPAIYVPSTRHLRALRALRAPSANVQYCTPQEQNTLGPWATRPPEENDAGGGKGTKKKERQGNRMQLGAKARVVTTVAAAVRQERQAKGRTSKQESSASLPPGRNRGSPPCGSPGRERPTCPYRSCGCRTPSHARPWHPKRHKD